MKKWILFGLSLLALTASLALSACGSQEQGGGETTMPQSEQPEQPSGEQGGAPAAPESGAGGGQ
ncbi:MAG: hypothetical protein ACK4P5_08275 [Fimbriimonadales bacterium]